MIYHLTGYVPRGPSTSNFRGGSILVIVFRFVAGSKNFKLTSGGIDMGVEPIREAHLGLLEKCLGEDAVENAGTR